MRQGCARRKWRWRDDHDEDIAHVLDALASKAVELVLDVAELAWAPTERAILGATQHGRDAKRVLHLIHVVLLVDASARAHLAPVRVTRVAEVALQQALGTPFA